MSAICILGKSTLARAAGLATIGICSFFKFTPTLVSSTWLGQTARQVRAFFSMARKNKPCIVFLGKLLCTEFCSTWVPQFLISTYLDECESMCSDRNLGQTSSDVSTQLLLEMDNKLNDNTNMFLIGACNNVRSIDPAFFRRFENQALSMLTFSTCLFFCSMEHHVLGHF